MLFRIAELLGWSLEQIEEGMSAAEFARWSAFFVARYWAEHPDSAPPADSEDPDTHSRMLDDIL